jgi:hypothetical protein
LLIERVPFLQPVLNKTNFKMSIFNVIRLLLFLFAFIVTVLALPADPVVAAPAVAVPTPTSLAPLYVVKTGRLAVSGCSNEDIAELTSAYSEAIQMMAKAQNVLNGGQVPWADAKDRALWARQSLLLYELFRIVIDPDTGAVVPPGPDVDVELNDAAALGTVTGKSIRRFLRPETIPKAHILEDVFSRPVSQAQAAMTGTPDEEAINYVVCGDEGITYLSATDPHPEEPGVQLNADGSKFFYRSAARFCNNETDQRASFRVSSWSLLSSRRYQWVSKCPYDGLPFRKDWRGAGCSRQILRHFYRCPDSIHRFWILSCHLLHRGILRSPKHSRHNCSPGRQRLD